jgi:phosphoribosylformylglycinamidine synthase
LDPRLGAAHAVAEASRNVACAGGRPLAVTNCLNFGNPEKPGGAYQLREAVGGMGDACRALGVPVVSGNVSLYNESADGPVFPTPTVGVVGVIDDVQRRAGIAWNAGDEIVLIGAAEPSLGGSEYLAHVHGLTAGRPPELDLEHELAVQRIVREMIADGDVRTAHDCSEGGLAVALAEMAIASGSGCVIHGDPPVGATGRLDEAWFGEAPSRIIIAGDPAAIATARERCAGAGVATFPLGAVAGTAIVLGSAQIDLSAATSRFDRALVDLS